MLRVPRRDFSLGCWLKLVELLISPTLVKCRGELDCPALEGGMEVHSGSPSNSMGPELDSVINSFQNEETQVRLESSLGDIGLAQTVVNAQCGPGGPDHGKYMVWSWWPGPWQIIDS